MILRRLLLFILFVLLLIGSAVFFIGTEKGTRVIWKTLTDQFPDQVSATRIEGGLAEKIHLENLNITIAYLDITVEQFDFGWQPAQSFKPELLIDTIKIHGLIINDNREPAAPSTEPFELEDLELPFPIKIKSFLLTKAEYHSQTLEESLKVEQLLFSVNADKDKIILDQLQVKADGFGVKFETDLSGELQPRDNYPLDFKIHWKANLPDQPEFKGEVRLHGNIEDLQIDQQLIEPAIIVLNAHLKNPLTDLNWTAQLQINDLQLQQIKSELPIIKIGTQLQGHGDLKQLQLSGDYAVTSEEFGNWDGLLDIEQALPSDIIINKLSIKSDDSNARVNFNGKILLEETPEISLQGSWQDLRWPLTGEPVASTNQGKFHVTGNPDNYQIQLNTTLSQQQVGDVVLDINGHGDTQHFVLEQLLSELLSGQIKTQGEVNWATEPLSFDLNGDWKDINWPQDGEKNQIQSPDGKFHLKGQPDQYTINLETTLDGSQIPPGDWTIVGTGSSSDFEMESLHGNVLDGAIDLTGKVSWGETLTWDMTLNGKNIDPEKLQKDWPGKLNLSAKISGSQVGEVLSAFVENTLIEGQLRGYPFKALADFKLIDNSLNIKQLNLSSGKSILKASGHAGKKLDLNWTLASPDLAELYPDAGGKLSAEGSINGTQNQPVIDATLEGNNIFAPGIKLGKLSSSIKLDLAKLESTIENVDSQFDIKINSSRLMFSENIIDTLDVIGAGTLSIHTIKTDLKSTQGNLHLLSQGGLKKDLWSGVIQELTLEEKKIGRWQLAKPEKLVMSKQQADLDKLCLTQKSASLCLGGHWKESGSWQIDSNIDQLALSILEPFLSSSLKLDGSVSTNLIASGTGSKNIRAMFDLNAPAGTIQLQDTEAPSQFKYDKATLNVVMNEQFTKASLLFDLIEPTRSPVTATMETTAFDPSTVNFNNLPLKGRLTTKIDDLSFIQAFTHELEELKGSLDVDLRIAGTVDKPTIEGHTKLAAELFLPTAGINLKDIKFDMTNHEGGALAFNGQARSGEGSLDLKGTVGKVEDGFPVQLEINGDRFELANLPEAWVLASPKLKISQHKNKLNIGGKITIPEAKLEPQGIASAVPLSDDVIILNQDTEKEDEQPLEITTNVKVILGDKISLSAAAFSGSLKGGLLITGKPDKPVMGTGEINIYDGSFSAYGQKLNISKGRILFAGGPIDSPNLDLKATRKVKKVTAGVHVTGPATSPELTLFSTPGMNQDNILSYLMIGKPLKEATSGDGDVLIGAATSLGFKGGAALTDNIGQSLGLDEFSIEGDGAEDASLQIGKYLTPKIYISYGVGLFEPVTQLKMRYDLSKRWSMEAESGSNSGMDFLYKYEK